MNTESRAVKLILLIEVILAVLLAVFCGVSAKTKVSRNNERKEKYQHKREKVMIVVDELDSNREKTEITDALLELDYENYYESQKTSRAMTITLFGMAVALFVLLCAFSIFRKNMREISRGVLMTPFRNALSIVPLLLVVVIYFVVGAFTSRINIPKPEDAEIDLTYVEVTDTEIYQGRATGARSRRVTRFYIYYEKRPGKEEKIQVDRDTYDTINKKGGYYLAEAEDGDSSVYFYFYDAKDYVVSG